MSRSWQRALYVPLIILAWLAVLVVVGWLLSHVTKTILVLVLSGIIAFALTPLVSLLARVAWPGPTHGGTERGATGDARADHSRGSTGIRKHFEWDTTLRGPVIPSQTSPQHPGSPAIPMPVSAGVSSC
jgi:hypothetical protein